MEQNTRGKFKAAGLRRILFMTALVVCSLSISAGPQYRAVVRDTICHVSADEMSEIAKLFFRQFQSCPDSLFSWAYVGLDDGEGKSEVKKKKSKESRNAIQLRYKDRFYDPRTCTGDVAIDIYVLGLRWWKDTHLGTRSSYTCAANDTYDHMHHMTATYSGSLLEGGNCIIKLTPISANEVQVHYEFDLTFGQVLASFISDKVWRNAIEWRFNTILDNLIEYAETGTVLQKSE